MTNTSSCGSLIYIANARLPTQKAHGFQICKMCEAFARHGTEVHLVHPRRHQSDPALQQRSVFDYYGIHPIFRLHTLPNLDVVRLERWFPRGSFTPAFFTHGLLWGLYTSLIARRREADLYYTRDGTIAFWLVRLGLPTVYEAHGVPKRGQRWLLKAIAQGAALRLAVTLTSFIRSGLIALGFPEEKIVVFPDGVDATMFSELPSQHECRRRLGLPLDRPIVGYIGRFRTLEMEKGIPELVQAMTHLHSGHGVAPLLLCVGGPMDVVPQYLSLASRFGVPESLLRFVDRVSNHEVLYWMRACDVVTIPWLWTEFSAYFTSPLKLFEYMAAGVPIVATDLPAIREILQHGENAWLVTPGDTAALAAGIHAVLVDPPRAQRLAAAALRCVKRYTWQQRARHILEAVASRAC